MVQGVSEESKQQEADRFNQTNSQTMRHMQALREELKNAQPNAEADDFEQDDEFDSYMEASLMQDSENPFTGLDGQAAGADIYEAAL